MLKPFVQKGRLEAGVDEAGRGCLAGPVVAAAVVLPQDFTNELINDSKLLRANQRDELREVIEKESLTWSVAFIDNKIVDEINILNATYAAMHKAIEGLEKTPEYLLIDGNRFKPFRNIRHQCIVKGDSKFISIAAASILAKTHRDEYMRRIGKDYPQYFWNDNKGYPTQQHKRAITQNGITPFHRLSFNLNEQMKLEF